MQEWSAETDVAIVGAGGCGMAAAIAAADRGVNVLILEKARLVEGNTALSQGMIPAAGTRFQKEAGISDTPEQMAEDILRQNNNESNPDLTLFLCRKSKNLVEWLVDYLDINLALVTDFKYTGFSQFRIHAPPSRTGRELLMKMKQAAGQRGNLLLVTECPVRSLVTDESGKVVGVKCGVTNEESVKSHKVILACDGFGAKREMLERYCPEIAHAIYHNQPTNTGDGIWWGMQLGAAVEHMDAYQAHASIATSQGLLVTWAVILNGGILVNKDGKRFGNETRKSYSEYARHVLMQPEAIAYDILEDNNYRSMLDNFEEFRQLVEAGGVRKSKSIEELANILNLNPTNLITTIEAYNSARITGIDEFGRTQFGPELRPPIYGVKVTAALLHTQGGLKINTRAQVLRSNGSVIPNLYAGGGVAVGISGSGCDGYLAGNGLLTALGWGKVAGEDAANSILGSI
ncbi:flavocytochrome c [Chloroflexota bacterium]